MGICCGKDPKSEPGPPGQRDKQHTGPALNGGPHLHVDGNASAKPAHLPTSPNNARGNDASHDRHHLSTNLTLAYDDDYHSCRDDFSAIDALSPRHSTCGVSACGSSELHAEQPGNSSARGPATRPPARVEHSTPASPFFTEQTVSISLRAKDQAAGSQDASEDRDGSLGRSSRPVGCLNLIEVLSGRMQPEQHSANGARSRGRAKEQTHAPDCKPACGVSLSKRDMSKSALECSMCYEDGDGRHYHVRGIDYMKTKLKVQSEKSIYRLAAADMFTFDRKQNHLAKLVELPRAPPAVHRMSPSSSECYPPLLIINLQLPTYAPSFFGGTDGPGWSIAYYFTLPDDFDPALFPNKKALGLFRRFVQNGKEADGSATRDRFKLIPRVVNVDEWAQTGPLSHGEHKLLSGYNEKPVLSRPQHLFFHEADYFEVDLDIHTYSYVARSALMSFMTRLKSIIFEIAFVIQGNNPDELPEQVLGCGRIYRSDFVGPRPFSSFLPGAPGAAEPHAEPDRAEPKA